MGIFDNAKNLKNNRWLCWDETLIEKMEGVSLQMNKPEKREIVFQCDAKWEGNVCGYFRVMKLGDKYRMYYRASNINADLQAHGETHPSYYCVSESEDGKSFTRLPVDKFEFEGEKNNNIFFTSEEMKDNLSVFYDENPDCPEEERFKALGMYQGPANHTYKWWNGCSLYLYVSKDGVSFTKKKVLPIKGAFDSYNVLIWDKDKQEYLLFYRTYHLEKGIEDQDGAEWCRHDRRTISVARSKDLETFEIVSPISYDGECDCAVQYYTNQIVKYDRAKDMFIGFPSRYKERQSDWDSFSQMPTAQFRSSIMEKFGREGYAVTDCTVMTSRNGFDFKRWEEAYLSPSVENDFNWWYGDCYLAYGLVETKAEEEGAPNEISFYAGEGYRRKNIAVRRYTVRLDGFFSWTANAKGGVIITKPFTFEGGELEINFQTSALGNLIITVLDEEGEPIEGYRSANIFGNSVKRYVRFEKPLKELQEKNIRLKFEMNDCSLFSFKFN